MKVILMIDIPDNLKNHLDKAGLNEILLKEDNDHVDSDPIECVERIMAERRKLFGDQDPCKDIVEMIVGETE